MCLEERIIATYFTLIQQPIYHLSFCGNLLASPALDVHPYYLWARHSSDTNIAKMKFACAKLVQIYQIATI